MLALNKSYRTTEEIADTSNLILDSINRQISECVARSGEPIITKSIDGCDEIKEILNDIEELLAKKYETIAIICKDEMETKNLYGALSKLGLNINLITDQNEEYSGGVSILPTYLSKGLEFDAVVVADAVDRLARLEGMGDQVAADHTDKDRQNREQSAKCH